MKMSKQIHLIIICSIMTYISACANTENEEFIIEGNSINLNMNKCEYSINGEQFKKLKLTKKCHFIRDNTTNKISSSFEADINSHVVLIVGTTVNNDPDFPLTKIRKDCGSQLQAIIIPKDGSPRLSKVISDTITCAGIGVDKKEFWIISH